MILADSVRHDAAPPVKTHHETSYRWQFVVLGCGLVKSSRTLADFGLHSLGSTSST